MVGLLLPQLHNSALTYIQYASTDGSSFGKDLLKISPGSMKSEDKKSSYFVKTILDDDWVGTPSEFANKAWIGYREVYVPNTAHYLVQVTEIYPMPGRIWSNYYNKTSWSGWKCITPT